MNLQSQKFKNYCLKIFFRRSKVKCYVEKEGEDKVRVTLNIIL